MFFDKKAQVARLSPNSDNNNKEKYATIINPISINIQPASAELTVIAEGAYGQVFTAFVPPSASGIQIGDRITVSGTNQDFIVKGINDWNQGIIPHLELVLFKGDN